MPPLQLRHPQTPVRRRRAATAAAAWRRVAGLGLFLAALVLGCAVAPGPPAQATPAPGAGAGEGTTAGVYGYWLDGANVAGYVDLILTSRPLAELQGAGADELAAAGAVLLTTYRKDSVWNQDGHPFRPVARVEALDPAASTVRINGQDYRYGAAARARVLDLLRHPKGTIPIARIRLPLEGGEQQAARLIQWLEGADE